MSPELALTARSRAAPGPAAFQGLSAEGLPPFDRQIVTLGVWKRGSLYDSPL